MGRFTTFSAGPGAASFCKLWYYVHNHPWEVREAIANGMLKLMPVHKLSNTQPDQTVYMTNVQYEMYAGAMFGNYLPNAFVAAGDENSYKYCLIHTMHPVDKFFEYCKADWERYDKMFRANNKGCADKEKVPYPYSREMVDEWFDDYAKRLKIPIKPEGPDSKFMENTIETFRKNDKTVQMQMIPHLVREYNLLPSSKGGEDPFVQTRAGIVYDLKKKLTASKVDSSTDFDEEQIDAWKQWVSMENKCQIEDGGECLGRDLLANAGTWAKIIPFLQKTALAP